MKTWSQLRTSPSGSIRSVLPALRELARVAVTEDVGEGDVSASIFPPSVRASALFLAKENGILSGIEMAQLVFQAVSENCRFKPLLRDGQEFAAGDLLAEIRGPLGALLTGERTALNFVQQLSGVATLTRRFVDAIGEGGPGIYDTRKTVPLLRWLQKRAVWHGGGRNHRFGLDDMAMLKNNHVDAAGGVAEAVALLRAGEAGKRRVPVCIEARDRAEAEAALRQRADIIMLDNMPPASMKRAVESLKRMAHDQGYPMPQIEISGGVTLANIVKMRGLPVDRISIGALTHSAPAVDISMRITQQ